MCARRTHCSACSTTARRAARGKRSDARTCWVAAGIETAAVTGIIDWTDAAVGDAAYDPGLMLRDLGPAALDTVLLRWPERDRPAIAERTLFYARCSALKDLEFGLTPGRDRYADKAIASLELLFPA